MSFSYHLISRKPSGLSLGQGGAPAPGSASPCAALTTVPRAHRAALHSLSAAPVRLSDSQNQLGWPSFFLPGSSVCAAVVVAWCQPTPKRRYIPPSPVLEGRFQFAFTFLLAGTIGFRAVPVNSPPSQPELSSNSSETSGRRKALDSPSLRLLASAACYGN